MHHLSSILSLCDNSSCVVGEARDEEMARACIYSPNVHEKVVYSNRVIKPTLALRMHLEVHFSFWMQGYAISGDFNNAPCTLNLMKSFDGKPTVYDCNALLYFYLKSKKACWQEFIEIGLCKEGKISAALQMWNQMLERGIVPSVAIFNTLLHAMFWEIL
ncbi:hypothetical protein V6N13_000425 [Hibiscus sabdariffa]